MKNLGLVLQTRASKHWPSNKATGSQGLAVTHASAADMDKCRRAQTLSLTANQQHSRQLQQVRAQTPQLQPASLSARPAVSTMQAYGTWPAGKSKAPGPTWNLNGPLGHLVGFGVRQPHQACIEEQGSPNVCIPGQVPRPNTPGVTRCLAPQIQPSDKGGTEVQKHCRSSAPPFVECSTVCLSCVCKRQKTRYWLLSPAHK